MAKESDRWQATTEVIVSEHYYFFYILLNNKYFKLLGSKKNDLAQ